MAAAVLAVLAIRGQVGDFMRRLSAPAATLRPRRCAPPLLELGARASRLIPADASVQYASRRPPDELDPDRRRFGPGLRPDADETRETVRYLLAPRIVFAAGPFEPPPYGPPPPYLVVTGAHLRIAGVTPLFENAAGGVYRRETAR